MLDIPLEVYKNQSFMATLNEQDCTVALYQRKTRLYLDLSADGAVIRQGAVCLPGVGILGNVLGFDGELYIIDTRTQPDEQQPPQWEGLGTRWKMYYLSGAEVSAMQAETAREAMDG